MDYPKQAEVDQPPMAGEGSRTIFTLIILALVLAISAYCAINFWGATTAIEPAPPPVETAPPPPAPAP
ncbi:MAG: hypothetical protein ACNA8W_08115 [Bradymonadaceae bacterium]